MHFDRFLRQACPPLGLEWRKYRRRTARHRVQERMGQLGVGDFASYLEYLESHPSEAAGLADLMVVTVSRFFRDRECWDNLAHEILPGLIEDMDAGRTVRVWSAGCCGGEEPYTMALVWLEYLQPRFPDHTLEILATDIDDASLARAWDGRFGAGSLREVPVRVRQKWFHRKNGMYLLDERVRELVRFEKRNLMTDATPPDRDLLLCRYLVFTYYRDRRRLEAALRLHAALRPRGVLMVGAKETLEVPELRLFAPVSKAGCFFGKM